MFWLTIFAAAILRIYLITRDSVPFTYDMGRDLLWSKDIAFYHTPTLIGPAASIWGVYFAPFWYYLLSIPLLLTGGHPLSAVYTTSATIILTGLIAFIFFKKYAGKFFANVLCTIILFNSIMINISTFAFHANLLPLLTFLTVIFSFLAVVKNPIFIAASFFTTGLMFSADPAPAVVFTLIGIFIFFYFKLFKTAKIIKTIFTSAIAYILPLSPLIIFELRNNLVQTKALAAYFAGNNPSLSGQLPFIERVTNRISLYWNFYLESFAGGNLIWALFLLLVATIGIYKFSKSPNPVLKILLKINLIYLVLSFLIFTFLVTVEVKGWYIYGIATVISTLFALGLYGFKNQKYKIIAILFLYLITNLLPFLKNNRITLAKNDPAQLSNQIAAVDLIYSDVDRPFSVYTFTPAIYDYNYQYLFWWYSIRKKQPMPGDFAYLPSVPEYVRNKNFYQNQPTQENLVYLIIENAHQNEFYTKSSWLRNFNDYKLVWQKSINEAVVVEKRQK